MTGFISRLAVYLYLTSEDTFSGDMILESALFAEYVICFE